MNRYNISTFQTSILDILQAMLAWNKVYFSNMYRMLEGSRRTFDRLLKDYCKIRDGKWSRKEKEREAKKERRREGGALPIIVLKRSLAKEKKDGGKEMGIRKGGREGRTRTVP